MNLIKTFKVMFIKIEKVQAVMAPGAFAGQTLLKRVGKEWMRRKTIK